MLRDFLASCIFIVVTFTSPIWAQFQTEKLKEGTGSISGRVTLGTDPAPGVLVGLYPGSQSGPIRGPSASTITDSEGRYSLTGIPAGSYRVKPTSPLYTLRGDSPLARRGRAVTLEEGERAEGVSFELVRGGVITGRVTDSGGRPLIMEFIQLWNADEKYPVHFDNPSMDQTDDRGIYRIYRVPPGRYLVSAGNIESNGNEMIMGIESFRPVTYHPSVTDRAQAAVVELAADEEASGIDIVVGKAVKSFSVSGRTVDAATGSPVANMEIGSQGLDNEGSRTESFGAGRSNSAGEYQIQGLLPGKYAAFAYSRGEANYYGDPTPFEITNEDVHEVDIKLLPGATIGGQVVLEGTGEASSLASLSGITVTANVETGTKDHSTFANGKLGQDLTFRIQGLSAGKARLSFSPFPFSGSAVGRDYSILRVERDGVPQVNGIDLKSGEQVTGVRIFVARGHGALRGQVKLQGGELPAGAVFRVGVRQDSPGAMGYNAQVEVDQQGQFLFESLPIGDYVVTLFPPMSRPGNNTLVRRRYSPVRQGVNVNPNATAEVSLVFDLESDQKEEKP